jgi:hypothetical protein
MSICLPTWVFIQLPRQFLPQTPRELTSVHDGQAFLQLHFSGFSWNGESNALHVSPFLHATSWRPGIRTPCPQHSYPPPIDLTGASQKQPPEECVTQQSKPTKKRRVQKKKPDIVVLDDINDEGDVQKNIGHWKDHWVIQLITV